jgi:DNA polymerase-3 subunit alpha
MVDDYIQVKHGRKPAEYPHPVMKDILEETHGVMVYQEQVMRIINRLGGIELSSAYTCIKAISKKKLPMIAKFREEFVAGACDKGLSKNEAAELFGMIEKFAGYGFNKSHSTAYALIAYMTAYLKAHFPVEFMAALLCGDMDKRNFKRKDPLVEHLEDCRRMEIEVLPPDVNRSDVEFTVAEGRIHFALSALKGCGEQAAAAIVASRQADGAFTSLFDFCERIDPTLVNRAAIETLIKAGAFDSLGARRSQLMAVVERALQSGASKLADRRSGQKGLFDSFDDGKAASAPVKLPDMPEWPEREKLANEKEVLGFYLTSHPLAEHDATLRTFCSHTTVSAATLPGRSEALVGGMLSAIKFSHTKNPRPGSTATKYAMFDLEDMEGILRCIVWPEEFSRFGEMVTPDAILILRGRIDKRAGSEEANLIVDELMTPADMSERYTKGMIVRVQEETHGVRGLEQLHEILRGYPGNLSLELLLCLADGSKVRCTCEGLRVGLDVELRGRIDELLGPGNVRLITARPSAVPAPKSRGNNYSRQPVRA